MYTNEKESRKREDTDARKAIRRHCKMPTDFSVENRTYMGIITNISPFGAFVRSLDIVKTGETVKMIIKAKKSTIKRTGTIKWSNQIGFGLQFATANA